MRRDAHHRLRHRHRHGRSSDRHRDRDGRRWRLLKLDAILDLPSRIGVDGSGTASTGHAEAQADEARQQEEHAGDGAEVDCKCRP